MTTSCEVPAIRQRRLAFLCRVYELAGANADRPIHVKEVARPLELSGDEIDAALQYYFESEILRPHTSWLSGIRVSLTRAGIDFVELAHSTRALGEPRVPAHYPDYPPLPSRADRYELHLGSGWSEKGAQPQEAGDPQDPPLAEPHLLISEPAIFGHLVVRGGIGSGKSECIVRPLLDQVIGKMPRPGERERDFAARLQQHEKEKCGLFVLDPKGELTEFVQRSAASVGRAADVRVLEVGGEWTYNALPRSLSPRVMAELLQEALEQVNGGAAAPQLYWRQTVKEWLRHALRLLGRGRSHVTMAHLHRLVGDEPWRTALVYQWEREERQRLEEAKHCEELGQVYRGPKPDFESTQFFRDWEETDSQVRQGVASSLRAITRHFVDAEVGSFLAPPLPATFRGFREVFEEGRIVVLRLPLAEYGPTGRLVGMLALADFAQEARARRAGRGGGGLRPAFVFLEDAPQYLTPTFVDFLGMSRQSRVSAVLSLQSEGQLGGAERRGLAAGLAEVARTQVVGSSPSAEGARRDSERFGGREIPEEVLTPAGACIAYEEKRYFSPEEMLALRTGEFVVCPFDGERNLPPRKIRAEMFHRTARRAELEAQVLPEKRTPHPVLEGETAEELELLHALLGPARYLLVEGEGKGGGESLLFSTSSGSLRLHLPVKDPVVRQVLAAELSDRLVVLWEPGAGALLREAVGPVPERVLCLPSLASYLAEEGAAKESVEALETLLRQRGSASPGREAAERARENLVLYAQVGRLLLREDRGRLERVRARMRADLEVSPQ